MSRLAFSLSVVVASVGCPRERAASPRDVQTAPAPVHDSGSYLDASAQSVERRRDLSRCVVASAPELAPGWRAVGWRPGPQLHDVVAVGHRGRHLLATTASTLCVTRDLGRTWSSPLPRETTLRAPTVRRLHRLDTLVMIAQGTDEAPAPPRVMTSRDGARWSNLVLPGDAGTTARVFTDGERLLFVASARRVWMSTGLGPFEPAGTLPGERADRVDLCGATMIARARMGGDYFHHRSDDFGRSWRAFRLGAIGLEGNDVRVRCLGWNGGVEAGYDPLPRSWSFDGGRTWAPADYDAKARRAARAEGEPRVIPHCGTTPGGARICVDSGRARIDSREVHAPSTCERIVALDDRRLVAFGSACGAFISYDLGGLWMPLSTSLHPLSASSGGRGGFISRDVAWRVAGGILWTTDGGEHWRLVPTVQGRTVERGVFVSRTHGVFVRSDGWVVATSDGGRTWRHVTRGEGARITSAQRWVMVTTADRARVSPDGGETWRMNAAIPSTVPLDPAMVLTASSRRVDPRPGLRVQQVGGRVEVLRGAATQVLARALPSRYELLAAHADADGVDRVLLDEGLVLHRAPRADAGAQPSSDARNSNSASTP